MFRTFYKKYIDTVPFWMCTTVLTAFLLGYVAALPPHTTSSSAKVVVEYSEARATAAEITTAIERFKELVIDHTATNVKRYNMYAESLAKGAARDVKDRTVAEQLRLLITYADEAAVTEVTWCEAAQKTLTALSGKVTQLGAMPDTAVLKQPQNAAQHPDADPGKKRATTAILHSAAHASPFEKFKRARAEAEILFSPAAQDVLLKRAVDRYRTENPGRTYIPLGALRPAPGTW